jgi:anaerobic selenocysteine-containing dehydrogenase
VYADPDRVRRPLRRTGDRWEELGWHDAFELVGSRLAQIRTSHGNDAIATYIGNPTGHNLGAMLWAPLFIQMLGSQRIFSGATVDQFPKNLSCRILYGDSWMFPVPDVDRTDFFLVLGANPLVSGGSIMSAPNMKARLRALRGRGGTVVVVDPRRTETARIADRHLFIRPGSDPFLLFAMVSVLFEENLVRPGRLAQFTDGIDSVRELAREFSPETVATVTGIDAATTRNLTRDFAAAERAVCYGRFGTSTVEFGTLASWLVDVVNLLTGNLDRPGGEMFPRPATGQSEPAVEDSGPVPYGRFHSRVRGFPEFDGQLPVSTLAEEIDSAGEDRIRAMITVAGNPAVSTPNGARLARAFESLDFMVSLDIYINETTRLADVILPSRVNFEETNFDLLFQTTSVRNMVHYSPAVFDPEPDSRSQWELLAEVAARVNGTTLEALDDLMLDGIIAAVIGRPGSRCEHLSPEDVRAKVGDTRGPERLLDLLLRAGPYGDGFDDGAEGLTLEKIRQVSHAIDLGALEPRFPEALKTPGRRIQLTHELLTRDVERLRKRLDSLAHPGGLVLVGRRQTRNMNSWLHNVDVLARGRRRCTLLVNGEDATRLGLRTGERARVKSRVGSVLAEVVVSDEMMPGVVSLPHGFGHDSPGTRLRVASEKQAGVNSNLLADELLLDELSGTSVLNGIPVEVSPASG